MKRPLGVVCCVWIFLVAVSMWLFPPNIVENCNYNGEKISIIGTIARKETRIVNKKETLIVYLKSAQVADVYVKTNPDSGNNSKQTQFHKTKGILCYILLDENCNQQYAKQNYKMGAKVMVQGTYFSYESASNPGQFDAALFYAMDGYQGSLQQAKIMKSSASYNYILEQLFQVKCHLLKKLDAIYEKEDAELLKAILLGEKSGLEMDVKKMYQKNGIIHILCISGLHISVLGMGLYQLLRRWNVPITIAIVLSFLFLMFYGLMVGNSISIVRAIGMFFIKCLGKIWKRTYDLSTALALMGALLLIEQPLYVFHSGYWLSFGSVAGIVVIYPVLQKSIAYYFRENDRIKKLTQPIMASLSVTIMTTPILLWFFYEIPVYSIFLNVLVIPLMTVVMVIGVGNLGYIWALDIFKKILQSELGLKECEFILLDYLEEIAELLALIHHVIFLIFESLCNMVDKLPGNRICTGKPEILQVFVYYTGLFIALYVLYRCSSKEKEHSFYKYRFIVAGVILVLSITNIMIPYRNSFMVTCLDVGQGDAGVILYENTAIIIDTGSSSRKNVGENILIPFLKYHGISKIEAVFVTHPDADHYNGILSLIEKSKDENLKIGCVILPQIITTNVKNSDGMKKLEQVSKENNIPVQYFQKGNLLKKKDLKILCVHPDKKDYGEDNNSYSLVLMIKYHMFSMAFMGDAQEEAEREALTCMKDYGTGQTVVLKAGHHGAKYASGDQLLGYLKPQYTVVSCGQHNRYGHPHKDVVKRLEKYNSKVFITYVTGAVNIITDGKHMEIQKFKETFP